MTTHTTHRRDPDRPSLRPNPLGVLIVLLTAATLGGAGVIIGLVSAPLSGGTLAGAALITTAALLIVRLLLVTDGDHSWH